MEEFKSKLQVEPLVNYNKEFESEELNEGDIDKDVFLYKISIFGNNHYIAMGNPKIHDENENIVYYVVYLVHEKKVVSKIGLYEYLIDELGEEEPDFSEGELVLNPKYYKQPYILNTFKLSDVENFENAKATLVSSEQYLLKEDGSLDLVEEDDTRKLELVKDISITSSSSEKRNQLKNILLKDMKLFALNCIEPQMKGSSGYISEKIKELKKVTVAMVDKKPAYVYETILNSGKSYELTELLIIALEINLNIKFLVLDENKRLNSLNLINNYTFSDYISIIDKNIKEYSKDAKSLQRKQVMIMTLTNYNPERIIFLQKNGNKFTLLSTNDKTITHISELDNKMLRLLNNLYKKDDHFYKYESQLLSLKGLFESLGDEEEEKEQEQDEEEQENGAEEDEEEQGKGAEEDEEEQGKGVEEDKEDEEEQENGAEEDEELPEPPKISVVAAEEKPKPPPTPKSSKLSMKEQMALIKNKKKEKEAKTKE